ncbi:MAG TPA: hypothetical protein VGX68_02935 [Thermoanaerobaculia bacterium]|jgi:hypothetical protein|nr:hypothetical protein [Thermoanaerobaculia bacterium]
MKRIWIIAAIGSFVSAATGFAQTPGLSVALAAILDQPTGGVCSQPQEDVVYAARRQGNFFKACSATATCNDTSGVNVSCSYTGSGGTCTFQNQNCAASVRGSVNCNGTITQCPICDCGGPVVCCTCFSTGDCFACCRCDGGTIRQCSQACGDF